MCDKKVIINKFENDMCDSLEIGTPGKGGAMKVYGNFKDLDGFKLKIEAAKAAREYAQQILEG